MPAAAAMPIFADIAVMMPAIFASAADSGRFFRRCGSAAGIAAMPPMPLPLSLQAFIQLPLLPAAPLSEALAIIVFRSISMLLMVAAAMP